MKTEYYDLAGEIVLKLNSIGNTTIKKWLSSKDFPVINPAAGNLVSGDFDNLYRLSQNAAVNNPVSEKDFAILFKYLLCLDYRSDSAEMRSVTLAAKAVPLNRANRDKIEIYFTYTEIDRANNVNEHYTYYCRNLMFYVKDKEIHKKIKLNNIYLNDYKDKLYIGFAPYPYCGNLKLINTAGAIVAEERGSPDEYDKKYLNAVKFLADKNCDVIFGPEMHGSPYLDGKIQKIFTKSESRVIICPSWHRNCQGKIINRAQVFYRQEGHGFETFLDKYVPAVLSNGEKEGLTNDGEFIYNYVILHANGLGRILFLICRDFLSEEIGKIIDDLNIDIVIVQCYTTDLTAFKSSANKIQNKRLIIIGNSCKAIKDSCEEAEHVAPVLYSAYDYRHKKNGDPFLISESKCIRECEYSHSGCPKILEVSVMDYNVKHKEKPGLSVRETN